MSGATTALRDDPFFKTLGGGRSTEIVPEAAPAPPPAPVDDGFFKTLGDQELRTIPKGDPVGGTLNRPIQEGRAPGIGTQAIGSLPTDPEQRRRVIAGQLFPDLPPQQAQARVFYGTDGRLAAVDPKGQPYYVDPEPLSLSRPSTLMPGNLVPSVAGLAGPALPAVGGVAGSLAAGPGSLVMGPLGAAAGAAVGDVARQGLAARYDPQGGFHYNPVQTAGEAGGAATGQYLGGLGVRIISPNLLGAAVPDINKVRAGVVLPGAEALQTKAEGMGVRNLTPGMLSGLPSLLAHEDAIASGSVGPALADKAATHYGGLRVQLGDASQGMLGNISSASDKTDAALMFQQGAEDATRIARQSANAAARPFYDKAQAGGQVMSPDLAQLIDLPAMQNALKAAAADYHNLYGKAANLDAPDFALWDLAKRKLDDAVTVADKAGERTTSLSIDSIRQRLLGNLDPAYPSYAAAREAAAPGQRLASRLQDSVGAAVGDGSERAKSILAPIFGTGGANPRAISEARTAFTDAGRSDEWNAGVRAYAQDIIDNSSKGEDGLNPQMLRRQLWGDKNTQDAMRAAMDPQQFQGFSNFMDVIQSAARARGMNSLTAPRQAAANSLQAAASDTPGVHIANTVGAALNPVRLAQVGSALPDRFARWRAGVNLDNISERLFSPQGASYLKQIGRLSPNSRAAINATSEFLGQTGGRRAVAPNMPQPEPVPDVNVLAAP